MEQWKIAMESTPFNGIFQAARNEIAACGYFVTCGRQEVWRVQPSIADEVRNSPGRAHGTSGVPAKSKTLWGEEEQWNE